MLPLIQRRCFSQSPISRKVNKPAKAPAQSSKPRQLPEHELQKQKIRRIEKASRDERMDITMMLTPVKTYMGGFTRPRDLRCSNWFPGGAYREGKKGKKPKQYEPPSPHVYRPYTVFILHSRYYIKTPRDQKDQQKFITGICLAKDFHKVVRFHNLVKGPKSSTEDMDNAIWPWYSHRLMKRVKWWEDQEERDKLRRQHEAGEFVDPSEPTPMPEENETVPTSDQSDSSPDEVPATPPASQVEPSQEENVILDLKQEESTVASEQNEEAASSPVSQSDEDAPSIETEHTSHASHTTAPVDESPSQISASSSDPVPSDPKPTTDKAKGKNKASTRKQEEDDEDEKRPEPVLTKQQLEEKIAKIRSKYEPTLQEQPFWRPLVAVTLPTRPLALSVERLAKSLPRGLPFYASMTSDDRKCLYSYTSRMLNLRSHRLLSLARDVSRRLAGDRGGLPGLRFSADQPGRAIDGFLLEEPIPEDVRKLMIGIGEYYVRAEELKEWAREEVVCADVFGLDDWGRRINSDGSVEDVPLAKPGESEEIEIIEEEDDDQDDD